MSVPGFDLLDKYKYVLFFGLLAVILVGICIAITRYAGKSETEESLKKFSLKILDLRSNNKLNEAHASAKNSKKMVKLKDHVDFQAFKNSEFYRNWTSKNSDLSIPSLKMYGFCVILMLNYEQIRSEVIRESFVYLTEHAFLNIPGVCSRPRLNQIMLDFQSIFVKNLQPRDLNEKDLWNAVRFMDLYALYFLFIENPKVATAYNFNQFVYLEPSEN